MIGTSEFDECLSCNCFAVRKAARAVTQHYDRALRKSGLRATQFNTLVVLAKAGPMPMAGLAEFLGMDRTSLTRNVQPPVRKKWIRMARRAGRGQGCSGSVGHPRDRLKRGTSRARSHDEACICT
jgi:hypothetical protein